MTTDVLEQKAREWWERNQYRASMKFSMSKILAAFTREIVEQCAKKVCFCCRNSGYAPVQKVGIDWRHKDTGYDMRCLAGPIWEAFGRKEQKE